MPLLALALRPPRYSMGLATTPQWTCTLTPLPCLNVRVVGSVPRTNSGVCCATPSAMAGDPGPQVLLGISTHSCCHLFKSAGAQSNQKLKMWGSVKGKSRRCMLPTLPVRGRLSRRSWRGWSRCAHLRKSSRSVPLPSLKLSTVLQT